MVGYAPLTGFDFWVALPALFTFIFYSAWEGNALVEQRRRAYMVAAKRSRSICNGLGLLTSEWAHATLWSVSHIALLISAFLYYLDRRTVALDTFDVVAISMFICNIILEKFYQRVFCTVSEASKDRDYNAICSSVSIALSFFGTATIVIYLVFAFIQGQIISGSIVTLHALWCVLASIYTITIHSYKVEANMHKVAATKKSDKVGKAGEV